MVKTHPPLLWAIKVLLVLLQCLPIVDGSTGVSAVLDVNHKNGKRQETHTHAKADAVHCLVANKHFTVDISLQAGDRRSSSIFTEAWDLQKITGSHVLQIIYSHAPAVSKSFTISHSLVPFLAADPHLVTA